MPGERRCSRQDPRQPGHPGEGPLGAIVGGMMGKQIANSFPALLQGLAGKAEATEVGS